MRLIILKTEGSELKTLFWVVKAAKYWLSRKIRSNRYDTINRIYFKEETFSDFIVLDVTICTKKVKVTYCNLT